MINSLSSFAPARQQQAPKPPAVDFSAIDTPVEASLMPGADMIASLVVGNFPSHNGVSHLEANGQTLEYTTKTTATGMEIDGSLNGTPFTCNSTVNQEAGSVQVSGTTSGGAIAETLEGIMGGVKISGTLGTIAFDQTFTLDPAAGFSGHIGDMDGNFGGQAFHQTINVGQDGQSLLIAGNLGDAAITGTISPGADGSVIVDRNIGGQAIHQTITPA